MELFGGGRSSGSTELKQTQERQQRESLASFARQQGELDQAAVAGMSGGGASSRGRGLLTFLNRGAGRSTLG